MEIKIVVPQVQQARYAAPRVAVTPVVEVISSVSVSYPSFAPGHYQQILLDTRTGELRFFESTEHLEPWNPAWTAANDVPRETWRRWHPGTLFSGRGPHMWFQPVPDLLAWVIDSGVKELPYLGVQDANRLLEELAPHAQALLDGLFQAGGELDWSATAARAGRTIGRLCDRHHRAQPATADADADLVDYAEIVARFPEVYRPGVLGAGRKRLADGCEGITRFLGCNEHWHPEIKKVFGRTADDGTYVYLDVLGVRSWYRTVLLGGDPRPAVEFADWDSEHSALADSGITSMTTDAGLASWSERVTTRAGSAGINLLGALEAAHAHRTVLREQEWNRLAVTGADIAEMKAEAVHGADIKALEAEQAVLIGRAISWGRTDSSIARRARTSEQTVTSLRSKAAGSPEAV
ncbi:hypothetical protein AB0K51_19220 [Kitasatospora sp. NPDC049285]|uniref:hypothetical protein n=1 Tax=Kitasatospora sp. NPDC049285 TaxID=3157096 RepID=UPI00341737BD